MEIVERLRKDARGPALEDADKIKLLRKERDGLREALKDMDGYVSRADRYYLKPETLAALKEKE